jgi:oligopeptide/dipeptide ABC transporter ATP-binding protein
MRQRAMIAIAVANRPRLIIADEPTTALDVTIQAQVMEVISDVTRSVGSALMLITHDLGLVAGIADRVIVMYAGSIFEAGDTDTIFYGSANPYTHGLIKSLPRVDALRRDRLHTIPGRPPSGLLRVQGCPFAPRCDLRYEDCSMPPPLTDVGGGHLSRCHRAGELAEGT